MADFLSKTRLKAEDIIKQAYEYLSKEYGDVGGLFTPASPFGQLLSVFANTLELEMVYLEHAVNESNMETAQSDAAIYGLASLTGHDAFRGHAARGTVRIRKNPSSEESDGVVKLMNRTILTFGGSSLQYFLNLDTDYISIDDSGNFVECEIVQGVVSQQKFVATGTILESYNITEKSSIDHDAIDVYVNGEKWLKKDSLYDCGYNAKEYVCRTSSTGGVALFFGNGDMGALLPAGAEIKVEYIIHQGEFGNMINADTSVEFGSVGYSVSGEEVDLNKICSVEIVAPPMLGANPEQTSLTKLLAPKASRSFVLANPESCQLYLSRFSQFNCVKAYSTKDDQFIEDDNIIYLTVLPNLLSRISSNEGGYDYFTLPLSNFILSDYEKKAIEKLFEDSGRLAIGTEVKVNTQLELKQYAIICIVKAFENYDKASIRSSIRSSLNTYFLNINRFDYIPKSDIISILESVEGIDSLDIFFISAENEEALRNGYYIKKTEYINPETHLKEYRSEKVLLKEGEDPNLGMDVYGNITLSNESVCIIHGGFKDRNGNDISEDISSDSLNTLTVVFDSDTPYSLYNKQKQKILNDILSK